MTGEEVKSILIQHLSKSSDSNDEVALAPIRKTSTHPPPPPEAPSPLELLRVEGKHEPSEWDINLYEIHFQKRIGRGTAGTTYLAKWSGQLVAVKVAAITEMGMEGWKTEVKSLRKLHHPNIIRLLGSVYNENPLTYCLVLEYCSGGDLTLAMGKPTHSSFFFKIAEDIAHGMSYLHNRGIIHRDIKPGNILIDGDVTTSAFTAKVTDFGVAAENSKPEMTSETGTYRWMAPEVIRHQPYSQKADCYSYGVLLWQLVTREDPFAGYSPLEAAGKVALENARPPFPADIPPAIKDLIQHCWSEDPDWRYSFEEVSAKLGERLGLPADEQRWIQAPCGHPVSIEPRQNEEIEEEDAILDSASYQLDGADKPRMRLMKLFGGRKGTQKK
jgi:mitogen-activated protein kinase kinase kinase 11